MNLVMKHQFVVKQAVRHPEITRINRNVGYKTRILSKCCVHNKTVCPKKKHNLLRCRFMKELSDFFSVSCKTAVARAIYLFIDVVGPRFAIQIAIRHTVFLAVLRTHTHTHTRTNSM